MRFRASVGTALPLWSVGWMLCPGVRGLGSVGTQTSRPGSPPAPYQRTRSHSLSPGVGASLGEEGEGGNPTGCSAGQVSLRGLQGPPLRTAVQVGWPGDLVVTGRKPQGHRGLLNTPLSGSSKHLGEFGFKEAEKHLKSICWLRTVKPLIEETIVPLQEYHQSQLLHSLGCHQHSA